MWYERISTERERRLNTSITDKGIVERSPDDLDAIGDAIDRYMMAVWRRAAELEAKVSDGSITEADLEDWP